MQEVAFQEKLKAGSLVENQKRQIRDREVLKENRYSRALLSNVHKSKYIKSSQREETCN